MTTASRISPRVKYATKTQIIRAIQIAEESGISVGGYELKPDGGIVIFKQAKSADDPAKERFFED